MVDYFFVHQKYVNMLDDSNDTTSASLQNDIMIAVDYEKYTTLLDDLNLLKSKLIHAEKALNEIKSFGYKSQFTVIDIALHNIKINSEDSKWL